MFDRENRCRQSVLFIVTCLLHGAAILVLIHVKSAGKSRRTTDQPLTIFLVKPQRANASALPTQPIIERRLPKRQARLLDLEIPLPDFSDPSMDNQTSESPEKIDWTGEAQRTSEDIASRTAPGSSNSPATAAGSVPWNPHTGGFESTPEGLKLRIVDPCFTLLHNWTHDPLLGTKGELQLNCNWQKPPPRGDLFDSIRRPPSGK